MNLIYCPVELNTTHDIGLKTLWVIMTTSQTYQSDVLAMYVYLISQAKQQKSNYINFEKINFHNDLKWPTTKICQIKNLLWKIGLIAIDKNGCKNWQNGFVKIFAIDKIILVKKYKLNTRQISNIAIRCYSVDDHVSKNSPYIIIVKDTDLNILLFPPEIIKYIKYIFVPFRNKIYDPLYYNIREYDSNNFSSFSKKIAKKELKISKNIGFNLVAKNNQIISNNWIVDCLKKWNSISEKFPKQIIKHKTNTKIFRKIENYLIAIHRGNFIENFSVTNKLTSKSVKGFSIKEIQIAIDKFSKLITNEYHIGLNRKIRFDEMILSKNRFSALLNLLLYDDLPIISEKEYIPKYLSTIQYIENKNIVLGYDEFKDNKKRKLDEYLQDIDQFGKQFLYDSHINYYTYACSNIKGLMRVYIEEFLLKFYEDQFQWWVEEQSRTIGLFQIDKIPFQAFIKHIAAEKGLKKLPKIKSRDDYGE